MLFSNVLASFRIPGWRNMASRLLQTVAIQTPQSLQSTTEAISLLKSQPSHYVVASIVGQKYILTPRDLLTIPRLKDVRIGDRLSLSEIHEVGSRDYTLRGNPILPHGAVNVEATVVEHTKGALEKIVKFKRRKHYRKTIQHKQTYTRLRIGPIQLGQQPSSS